MILPLINAISELLFKRNVITLCTDPKIAILKMIHHWFYMAAAAAECMYLSRCSAGNGKFNDTTWKLFYVSHPWKIGNFKELLMSSPQQLDEK